jgi:hypothetical protein
MTIYVLTIDIVTINGMVNNGKSYVNSGERW